MSRILVVEDELIIVEDVCLTLQELGYEVAGRARSGSEALLEVERTRPDLVLIDVQLGGRVDGVQAGAAIRERHRVPIIFLTAHSDESILARAKETGAHGYLLKPFDSRYLRAAIEVALGRHELQQKLEQRLALSERLAAISTMAAGMAHEINNPLAATLGNVDFAMRSIAELVEVIRSGATTPNDSLRLLAEVVEALADAQRAGGRVRGIVGDLAKFSRAEEPSKDLVDLAEVMPSAKRVTQHLVTRDVSLVTRAGTTPLVEANEGQLVQVLANLIANAIHARRHTRHNGSLERRSRSVPRCHRARLRGRHPKTRILSLDRCHRYLDPPGATSRWSAAGLPQRPFLRGFGRQEARLLRISGQAHQRRRVRDVPRLSGYIQADACGCRTIVNTEIGAS